MFNNLSFLYFIYGPSNPRRFQSYPMLPQMFFIIYLYYNDFFISCLEHQIHAFDGCIIYLFTQKQYFPSIKIIYNYYRMSFMGYNQYFTQQKGSEPNDRALFSNYIDISQFIDLENLPKSKHFANEDDKIITLTNESTKILPTQKQIQNKAGEGSKTTIVFQPKVRENYRKVYKGTKDDTVELNINFKTLIVHYFKVLKIANELSQYQIKHVSQFNDRVASFSSLMIFFEDSEANRSIRQKSLELFSSSDCIKRILSGRCKMRNKLQMIKFIEKVRLNILTTGKGYKWKDIIKKQH